MSENRIPALRKMAASADPGTAAAARNALAKHASAPEPELPPGPVIARRGGPFPATGHGDQVWVAVRDGEETARRWVQYRARLLVSWAGSRSYLVPTSVEVDEERQRVYVTTQASELVPA